MKLGSILFAFALTGSSIASAANPAMPMTNESVSQLRNYFNDDRMYPSTKACFEQQRPKEDCLFEYTIKTDEAFNEAGFSLEKTLLKIQTERLYQINQTRVFGESLLGVYLTIKVERQRTRLIDEGVITPEFWPAMMAAAKAAEAANK